MPINFAVLPFEFEKLAPLLSKLRNVAQLKASKAATTTQMCQLSTPFLKSQKRVQTESTKNCFDQI